MTPMSKQVGHLIIAVIASISMIAVAYFKIGPENAWLYVFVAWTFVFAAFELYPNLKARNKRGPN